MKAKYRIIKEVSPSKWESVYDCEADCEEDVMKSFIVLNTNLIPIHNIHKNPFTMIMDNNTGEGRRYKVECVDHEQA